MAPTPITPTPLTDDGVASVTPVATDPTNGNSVPNTAGLHLVLKNTDASSRTITFTTPGTVSGVAIDDPQHTLAAGEEKRYGQFPTNAYGTTLVFTTSNALVTVAAYVS